MTRAFIVVLYSALLIGAVHGAHFADDPSRHPYLTCTAKRLFSFGSTHRSRPIAEFAAIVRWADESEQWGPGYSNWGLAQDRALTCRRVGKGPYIQCRASARPCRPKDA